MNLDYTTQAEEEPVMPMHTPLDWEDLQVWRNARGLLRAVGGRRLDRVLREDPGVFLIGAEILRIEHITAHSSAADGVRKAASGG